MSNTYLPNSNFASKSHISNMDEYKKMYESSINDPPAFWENMKFILEQAEEIGLYIPVDYSENPERYCGQMITSTPYDFKKKN